MNKLLNIFFWTIAVLTLCLVVLKLFTGTLSEDRETEAALKTLEVNVRYNSISAAKRKVFGNIVPFGIVWRTGSGAVTEISFSEDCTFGGKKIKAGKYSLWSIPTEKEWTILLNKETGQYGTNYDAEKDYIRVEVIPKILLEKQDDLRINLVRQAEEKISLFIRWDTIEAEVLIQE